MVQDRRLPKVVKRTLKRFILNQKYFIKCKKFVGYRVPFINSTTLIHTTTKRSTIIF